jgi:hypothetical protein
MSVAKREVPIFSLIEKNGYKIENTKAENKIINKILIDLNPTGLDAIYIYNIFFKMI